MDDPLGSTSQAIFALAEVFDNSYSCDDSARMKTYSTVQTQFLTTILTGQKETRIVSNHMKRPKLAQNYWY